MAKLRARWTMWNHVRTVGCSPAWRLDPALASIDGLPVGQIWAA